MTGDVSCLESAEALLKDFDLDLQQDDLQSSCDVFLFINSEETPKEKVLGAFGLNDSEGEICICRPSAGKTYI